MFSNLNVSSDQKTASFHINDMDLSVINALRRIILSEIPHIGIEFDPYHLEESDILIITNTSPLHNEFLGHRISLLPVHLPPDMLQQRLPIKLKFILRKENKGTSTIIVTTKDIKIYDEDGSLFDEKFHKRVFPPFSPEPGKEYYPVIVKLKPNSANSVEGQSVNIEFKVRMDIAKKHARWCPVSLCTFENVVDEQLAKEARSIIPADALNKFDTLDRQRYFVTNKHGDPSAFIFKIESESSFGACDMFVKGIDVLEEKLKNVLDTYNTNVKKDVLENGMNIFNFKDEDHTMGNLLQCMVYNKHSRIRGDAVLEYVGYFVPHPLKTDMVMKIKAESDETDVSALLINIIKETRKSIKAIKQKFIEFANMSSGDEGAEIYEKVKQQTVIDDNDDDIDNNVVQRQVPIIEPPEVEKKKVTRKKTTTDAVVKKPRVAKKVAKVDDGEEEPKVIRKKKTSEDGAEPKKKVVRKKKTEDI